MLLGSAQYAILNRRLSKRRIFPLSFPSMTIERFMPYQQTCIAYLLTIPIPKYTQKCYNTYVQKGIISIPFRVIVN